MCIRVQTRFYVRPLITSLHLAPDVVILNPCISLRFNREKWRSHQMTVEHFWRHVCGAMQSNIAFGHVHRIETWTKHNDFLKIELIQRKFFIWRAKANTLLLAQETSSHFNTQKTISLHSTASCTARRRVQYSLDRKHCGKGGRLFLLPSVSSCPTLFYFRSHSLSHSRLLTPLSVTAVPCIISSLACLYCFLSFPSSTSFNSFLSSLLLSFIYCFLRSFFFPSLRLYFFFLSFFGSFFPSLFTFSFLTSSLFSFLWETARSVLFKVSADTTFTESHLWLQFLNSTPWL